MIKHYNQTQSWKEKIYLNSTDPHYSTSWKEIRAGTQNRTLETETEAGAMEEYYGGILLTADYSTCFLSTRDHLPRLGNTNNGLEFPTEVINPEQCPADLATAVL